jgi:hypothetical protein
VTEHEQSTPEMIEETAPGRPGGMAIAGLAVGVLTIVAFIAASGTPAAGLVSVATALCGGVLGGVAWRRVDRGLDGKRGLPLAIAAVALCVVWLFLFALLGRLQYRAFQNTCVAQQRQIGMALIAFQQDHGRFPKDWQELADSGPEGAAVARFTCPGRHWLDPRPARHPYGLNAALLGTSLAGTDPSAILLCADAAGPLIRTPADIARTRHGIWYTATFTDGHVEILFQKAPVTLKP